ncbi:beta keto-acyl synthase [Amycolatopsis coloradensis]|uniref:Beta keto-acyl synthase n=1 Tax=Amycolatopsis coloradensis TaxID=76021 RepID=A0A1R0KTU0_9PSEU|nr:type I polyketide synthase [Amycolatopsis coloradensis]OLZ51471.1 beta keto-acyl synthase [Amycolatopsis coloradensis]
MTEFSRERQVPVAIVGVGALLPGATDTGRFWRVVVSGRDTITDVPPSRWLTEDFYDPDPSLPDKTYARRGAFLPKVPFDPVAYGVPPTNLAATDSAQLLALMVAEQTLGDLAGTLDAEARERVSVVLGASVLPLYGQMAHRLERPVWLKALREEGIEEPRAQAICDTLSRHYVPWQEATFPGVLTNVVAGRIANRFDLHGMNYTTDAACASSLSAVSAGVADLALGRSDLVLAGGADTQNGVEMFMCFSKTPALSPTGDCRPFSADADGTMLGEGVVMLALKRLSDAERDGDNIYAVIRGIGSSSDGRSTAVYAPLPEGQARALRRAYEEAGYGPETVELVEAHGTGTKAGDRAEFTALRSVFDDSGRPDRQWCALGSVKSQLGHTKCTAGATGLLKAALALHHKVLPPTIKVDRPNPALELPASPFYLNTRARPWISADDKPRRASVSSFGFGGSNFHVALEEYVPPPGTATRRPRNHSAAATELLLLGAGTAEALIARTRELAAAARESGEELATLARRTQCEFSAADEARLAVIAADPGDLATRLDQAAESIARNPAEPISLPTGTYYRLGEATQGRVGFLFPGQGSQYVDMGADVAVHVLAARAAWDRAAATDLDGPPVHRVVFPPPAFGEEESAEQTRLLNATEWAQPALAAHSVALLAVLRELGLTADCAAGHSFGELIALHHAGAFDAETLLRLGRRRGLLMREAAQHTPGAMLAVAATAEDVQRAIDELGDPGVLVIANHNAPQQVTVSGDRASVEKLARMLGERKVTSQELATSGAFHSPLVADAVPKLTAFLDDLDVSAPRIPVYGKAGGAIYPAQPGAVRRGIAEHVVSPVHFTDTVEAMYADGVRTFVEVGAGATLTRLVGRILDGRPHSAVALDRPRRNGLTCLQDGLARLAVDGVDLTFEALWEPYGPAHQETPDSEARPSRPAMAVPIDGGNHGRRYPPPGGHRELPPPNSSRPPGPSVTSSTTPVPAAPQAADPEQNGNRLVPTTTPPNEPNDLPPALKPLPDLAGLLDDDWLTVLQTTQQQTADAHAAYQKMVTDAHLAFLRLSETSLNGLLGQREGASGEYATTPVNGHGDSGAGLRWSTTRQAVTAEPTAPAETHEHTQPVAEPPARPAAPEPVPAPRVPMREPMREPAPALEPAAAAAGHRNAATAVIEAPVSEPGSEPGVDLTDSLLSVVSELTGYPVEILGLDMELEGDLGVDSIKRVQILAALRERVGGLPEQDVAGLAELRTLREVVESAGGRVTASPRESETRAAEPVSVDEPTPRPEPEPPPVWRRVVRAVPAPPRGMAIPGLGDHPVVVTQDGTGVAEAVADLLAGRGIQAEVADSVPPGARAVLFLGGLRPAPTRAEGMAVLREGFEAAQALAPVRSADGGLFVTVQDTGGDFGLGGRHEGRAWLGGLAGLARTAALEWPGAAVKVIDCERGDRSAGAVAEAVVAELVAGGPARDVGLRADGTRLVPRAEPAALPPSSGGPRIGPGSVVVVSGGARGVTAAAVRALAREHRPRFVLLGRTPLTEEPAGWAGLTDEAGLTRAIAAEGTSTPAEITALARQVLATREIRATLDALAGYGSEAEYLPIDVRDGTALTDALTRIRREWGLITGLVHGAGVLADHRIEDKTAEQWDRVVGVKVDGLGELLEATADDPLEMIVVFSSVAGVFGNAGQADYSAANAVLDLVASEQRVRRPECLVRALAWGPWRGGMVSAGLAEHFDRAGVSLLDPGSAADAFVAELSDAPGGDTRVVLTAGEDGPGDRLNAASIRVDAASHPYLLDHQPADVPVLPMASALDWLAGAARDWRPRPGTLVLRDVRVLRTADLSRLENDGHRFVVEGRQAESGGKAVALELRDGDRATTFYRATLVPDRPPCAEWTVPAELVPPVIDVFYGGPRHFHGPAFQVLLSTESLSREGALGVVEGLSARGWPGSGWTTDVAAVDGAFQLAVLWAEFVLDAGALPMGVGEFRLHRDGLLPGEGRCVVRAGSVRDTRVTCDVALLDPDGEPRFELLAVELVRRPD